MVKFSFRSIFSLFIILAAAGAAAWFWFGRESEEHRIKLQLQELCSRAARNADRSAASALLQGQSVARLFAPECVLEIRTGMFSGRYTPEEIGANVMRVNAMLLHSELSVSGVTVRLIDENNAEAEFTGRFRGTMKNDAQIDEIRELICNFRKIDGEWKISAIQVRDVLEK